MKNAIAPMYRPYPNDPYNSLYEFLFCDNLAYFEANNNSTDEHPWAAIFAKQSDEIALLEIANDPLMESRVRLLAANRLVANGGAQPRTELLAAIIEVGLEGGLDVVAAYGDGSARYLNHAENVIIWDAATEESNALIDQLWQHSITVVNQIGPWDKARLAPPETGMVRLSFLVSGQLYFGQGPMDMFFKDPMAGPVLNSALQLMTFLMEHSQKK